MRYIWGLLIPIDMLNLEMPEDVRKYILKVQGDIKAKKGIGKYSQQQTIIAIIREHQQLAKGKKES